MSMSELDEKLDELISPWVDGAPSDVIEASLLQLIEQVKQTFVDEGWGKTQINQNDVKVLSWTGDPLMTGKEWYDRFIDEWERTKKRWLDDRDRQGVVEAAKKAAGK